jgi:hypothetical protein
MVHYIKALLGDKRLIRSAPWAERDPDFRGACIHGITLYAWRKSWRQQGAEVQASEKDPAGWGAADKFTVVLKTPGLNAKRVLTMGKQKDLEKLRAKEKRQIKAL